MAGPQTMEAQSVSSKWGTLCIEKATDPDGENNGQPSNFQANEIIVRFTEGIPDVSFVLDPSYTIQEVKLLVCLFCSLSPNNTSIDHRFVNIDLPC